MWWRRQCSHHPKPQTTALFARLLDRAVGRLGDIARLTACQANGTLDLRGGHDRLYPMKRLLIFALLTVISGAATEPRERPRLAPGSIGETARPDGGEARQDRAFASDPGDGSFQSFLQARSRRPVGLEAVPEVVAARAEKAVEKQAAATKTGSSGMTGPETTDREVLVLPKMEVTAEKVTKLKAQLVELEARQATEERIAARAAETSVLEMILNPPFLRLGGYSSDASAALARKRLEVLGWVKLLTLSLAEARTPEEKRRIQTDIDGLNEMTRQWR